MDEDKIFELFDKYQDQWNEWDGSSISYINFEKAINEALMLHIVSSRRKLLKGFASKFNDRFDKGYGIPIMDWMIDEFLETL